MQIMTNRSYAWILVLMVLCLVNAGCVQVGQLRMILIPATIPLASEQVDAEAKRFHPQAGKASIYVIREDILTAHLALFQVSLDGKDQGKLARGTYFLFTVQPGKHEVVFTGDMHKGNETILAVEGGIYYLEIRPEVRMLASYVNLLRIDEERGRKMVLEGKHAEIKSAD